MSGGHFEYHQLYLLPDAIDVELSRPEAQENPYLQTALTWVKNGSAKLFELMKAVDYYIEGDHGEAELKSALIKYLGYNPVLEPLNGMSKEAAINWLDSLRNKKESNS
ncbi:MAG TPA: hypothetical protein VFM18_07645 [Methanosarcina sp.]|nr:hypothetical protein [Methanosarcina sp.]